MAKLFISLLKTARPRQWVKNFSLAAALLFSGKLFYLPSFLTIVGAIIIFSILASSVYFINDIVDISRDRLHPFKKFRPIASGELPVPIALFFASFGVLVSLYLSFNISFFFFLVCLVYFCFIRQV